MQYGGKYRMFDNSRIQTYPISERTNKVKRKDIVTPVHVLQQDYACSKETLEKIEIVAQEIVSTVEARRPVIVFSGAHLIKNGLGLLMADLVQRGLITLFAGNGATSIHDFELALIGETSEYVPQALERGQFGMAYEFAYHNTAIRLGDQRRLGYGESLGRMIWDEEFRSEVLRIVGRDNSPRTFSHPELSLLATCYRDNVPFTVHTGIGTDVIDQHASFDGHAKGGCSGRDFLIYTEEVCKLTQGGVILNIGSAVTGPEVFLKAVSMAGNIGCIPNRIMTADFDIRGFESAAMTDESKQNYYFRDQKSVVTRIPEAFNGRGFYIQGNQKSTIPLLYRKIMEKVG
jgi:hypothetical protein